MSSGIQRDYLPESPFPGIDPYDYSYRNIFFARENERRSLIRLIVMYRGVLLYSASGVGKSSLINAGLIRDAITEGLSPEKIRVQPRTGEEIVIQRIEDTVGGELSYLPSIFPFEKDEKRLVLSLETFLDIVRGKAAAQSPLLIFDQFEEWVTLFGESPNQPAANLRSSQAKVLDMIVSIINDRVLPAKVLISLREDYLAELTPMFKRCPNLSDQYLRLTPLGGDDVYRVITEPFKRYPDRFSPPINEKLAEKVKAEFVERSAMTDIRLTEVQIVASELFGAGKDAEEVFDRLGVKGILEQYSSRAIGELSKDEQEPAICLLSRLVTSGGTRNVVSKEDLLSRTAEEEGIDPNLLTSTLNKLERKTPLVRRELRRKVYCYEIASEFLVDWIRQKKHERQGVLLERRNRKLRAARYRRALFVIVPLLLFLLLTVEWVAMEKKKQARQSMSRDLASLAISKVSTNPEMSIYLALQSALATYTADHVVTDEAERALHEAIQTSHLVSTFGAPRTSVWALAFSPNGVDLAVAYRDSTVRIWNSVSGRLERELKGGHLGMTGVSFSPDGKRLAVSSEDDTVRIWDAAGGDLITKLYAYSGGMRCVRFSPDGKLLATCGNTGTITVWNPGRGYEIFRSYRLADRIHSIAFSPDGRTIAASGNGRFYLCDLYSGATPKRKYSGILEIYSISFCGSDKLVMGGRDTQAALWTIDRSLHDWSLSRSLSGHTNTVLCVACSKDSRSIVTASFDHSAKVWDANSGQVRYTLGGHADAVSSAEFSPEGSRLVTGSYDGMIRIWATEPLGERGGFAAGDGAVKCMQYSPDSSLLAFGLGNAIAVCEARSGKRLHTFYGHSGVVRSVAFDQGGSRLVSTATGDTTAIVWDLASAKRLTTLFGHRSLLDAEFTLAGNRVVTADDSMLITWDLTAGRPLASLVLGAGKLTSIAWCNDMSRVAVTQSDTLLRVYDVSGTVAHELITLKGYPGRITSLAVSPDGQIIAAGGNAGMAILWDAESGEKIGTLRGHTDTIWRIVFSSDGKKVATASFDKTARVWDVSEQRELAYCGGHAWWVRSVCFSPDGLYLATGDDYGKIRIFTLKVEDLLHLGMDHLTRPVNEKDFASFLHTNQSWRSMKPTNLFIEGRNAAMKGDTETAGEKFRQARLLDPAIMDVDPGVEARKIFLKSLLQTGTIFALNRRPDTALVILHQARAVDPNVHFGQTGLQALIDDGYDLAVRGEVKTALHIYTEVMKLDSTFEIPAMYWNNISWWGCLWGYGHESWVLDASERAVEMNPPELNYRDTRGLVLALNGHFTQAIKDFSAYAAAAYGTAREQRVKWVQMLRSGENPFTAEGLRKIREADLTLLGYSSQ